MFRTLACSWDGHAGVNVKTLALERNRSPTEKQRQRGALLLRSHHHNRRKTLLIEPKFQLGFLVYSVSGLLASSLLLYGANRFCFARITEYALQAGLPEGHEFFRSLAQLQNNFDRIFFVSLIFVCAICLAHGLSYSNRIAGPIYHLRKYLRAFAQGKMNVPIRFRKTDVFSDLEPLVNEALKTSSHCSKDKKAS